MVCKSYQKYFIRDPAMCNVKVLPRYWNEQFLVVLQHNPQVRERCSENRIYRVSQKHALSESSSCKQQPRGDQIQDVLNMISPRLLLAG